MAVTGMLPPHRATTEELANLNQAEGRRGVARFEPYATAAKDMARLQKWSGARDSSFAEHPDDRVRRDYVLFGYQKGPGSRGQWHALLQEELENVEAQGALASPLMVSFLPWIHSRVESSFRPIRFLPEPTLPPSAIKARSHEFLSSLQEGSVKMAPEERELLKAISRWGRQATGDNFATVLEYLPVEEIHCLLPHVDKVPEELVWLMAVYASRKIAGSSDAGGLPRPLPLEWGGYSRIHEVLLDCADPGVTPLKEGEAWPIPQDVLKRIRGWLASHDVKGLFHKREPAKLPTHFSPEAFRSLWIFEENPLPDPIGQRARRVLDSLRKSSTELSDGERLKRSQLAWSVVLASSEEAISHCLDDETASRKAGAPWHEADLSATTDVLRTAAPRLTDLVHHPRVRESTWRRHLDMIVPSSSADWESIGFHVGDEPFRPEEEELLLAAHKTIAENEARRVPIGQELMVSALLRAAGRRNSPGPRSLISKILRATVTAFLESRHTDWGIETPEDAPKMMIPMLVDEVGAAPPRTKDDTILLTEQDVELLLEACLEVGDTRSQVKIASHPALTPRLAVRVMQESSSKKVRPAIASSPSLREHPEVREILQQSRDANVLRSLLKDGRPDEVERLFRAAVERGEKEALDILAELDATSVKGLDREMFLPYLSSDDREVRERAFVLMGKVGLEP